MDEVLKRGVVRWEEHNRAIAVFIADGRDQADFNPVYTDTLKAGFSAWEQASNGKLRFAYVGEASEAEIVCSWSTDPEKLRQGIGAENIDLFGREKTISRAQMTIPIKGATPLTAAQMQALCLHVIGHALGISGHSRDPGDALYPFFSGQTLSQRDKNTLRRLYSDDPLVTGARAPQVDPATLDPISRLTHDAIAAADAGDFVEATRKFEQAYAMDNSRPQLAHNLCACYSKLATQRYDERNFQEAETYIRKAVPMCERGATKQVLAGVLNNLVAIMQATGRHEEAARFIMEHASVLSLVMDSPMKKARAVQLEEEARQLSAKKEPEQAEGKIREALSVEPDSSYLHASLGRYLLDQARFEEAAEASKKAISLNPKSAGAWLSLAACYQRLGRSRDCLEAYHNLLKHQPQFPGADLIRKSIADLEQEIAEQDKANATGPDYVATGLESGPYTWKYWDGAIPVYIKDGSAVLHYLPSFADILKQSFAEWEQAMEGKVKFQYVDKPEAAKIMCEWTNDPSVLRKKDSRGVTHVIPMKDRIAQARIFLLTQDSSRTLAECDMHSVCLHEIGHALGISGHSPNPSDIMYKASYVQALTARDKATAMRIYTDDSLVASAPLKPEEGGTQDESGPDAKFRQLANQATEAAKSGDLKSAVKMYEQALAMDPYHPLVLGNLCGCYNNLASEKLKKRKARDAEQYLRKAVDFCERSADKEQLAATLRNLALVLASAGKREEAAQVRQRAETLQPASKAASQTQPGAGGSVANAAGIAQSPAEEGNAGAGSTSESGTAGSDAAGAAGITVVRPQGSLGARIIMVPLGYRKGKYNICENPNKSVPDVDIPVAAWIGPMAADSPAAECGLQENDAVIAVDGVNSVGISPREFYNRFWGAPGSAVKITVSRRKGQVECNCTRAAPTERPQDPLHSEGVAFVSGMIGVKVLPKVSVGGAWSHSTISVAEIVEFEVEDVYPDTPAQAAGLKAGDVIHAVDGRRVDRRNFADTISGQPGTDVTVAVRRGKYGVRFTCRRADVRTAPEEVRHDFAARRCF